MRECAIPGQHDPVRLGDNIRIRGHDDGTRPDLGRHTLERLLRRVQVAAVVIDECGCHRLPLVDGMASALRGSVSTASRKARATALNAASAM